jgi:hypothetical protein
VLSTPTVGIRGRQCVPEGVHETRCSRPSKRYQVPVARWSTYGQPANRTLDAIRTKLDKKRLLSDVRVLPDLSFVLLTGFCQRAKLSHVSRTLSAGSTQTIVDIEDDVEGDGHTGSAMSAVSARSHDWTPCVIALTCKCFRLRQ